MDFDEALLLHILVKPNAVPLKWDNLSKICINLKILPLFRVKRKADTSYD